MEEFNIIDKIKRLTSMNDRSNNLNIGDDCAVLKNMSNERDILITTDALVENIHFDLKYCTFYDIGYKSAQVNISDIICKGGAPKSMFISLSIPSRIREENIMMFYKGLLDACSHYNIEVSGGDLTSSKDSFFISITLVGIINKNKAVLRSNAQVGDNLYVLGVLGESDLGLKKLMSGKFDINDKVVQSHLRPKLFVKEWQNILNKYSVSSAIDVSDGLLQEANHIATASNVQIEIWENSNWALVNSEYATSNNKKDILKSILTGGEDYAILFTSSKKIDDDNNIIRIGKVLNSYNSSNRVLFIDSNGNKVNFNVLGYQHR